MVTSDAYRDGLGGIILHCYHGRIPAGGSSLLHTSCPRGPCKARLQVRMMVRADDACAMQWEEKHMSYNFDVRAGPVHVEWFKGGTTNLSFNCLDRNIEKGLGEAPCFIWEGNEPSARPSSTRCPPACCPCPPWIMRVSRRLQGCDGRECASLHTVPSTSHMLHCGAARVHV